jgi:hypothetical protein
MDINRRWALEMNKEKTGYLSDIQKKNSSIYET